MGELMPATSKKQQRLMAIAEHAPSKLFKKNRGVLKMSHDQLHDFAATKRKGLPMKRKADKRTFQHSASSYDFRDHLGKNA